LDDVALVPCGSFGFAEGASTGVGLSVDTAEVIVVGTGAATVGGGATTTGVGGGKSLGMGRVSFGLSADFSVLVAAGLSSCNAGGDGFLLAKYAMATATAMSAQNARMACSRLGLFFAGGVGGVDSRRSSFVVVSAALTTELGPVRFGRRGVGSWGVTGAMGAGSGLSGLLGVAVVAAIAADVGFCGVEAARALALRARISLRCARDGFLLTIRRYSMPVRSGKTPVLWRMKPKPRHNVAPTS